MRLILLVYFVMHCFKTLLFGSSNSFHSVVFDYSQYSVINANIQHINNTKIEQISGITGWALFGLNPNGDDNATITYLYTKFYQKNRSNNSIDNNGFKNNPDNKELNDTIKWFHDNRFIITVTSMVVFLSIVYLLNLIINFLSKVTPKKKKATETNGIITSDGNLFAIKPKYFNPTFTSFMISIVLTGYCNLTTVIIWQLINIETVTIINFLLVISVLILIVVGFPLFVINLLFDSNIDLYNRKVMDNYGTLYLGFKQGMQSKFILIVLVRQILYAVAINISTVFSYGQNSFILIVNTLFLFSIVYLDPYENKITKYQNIILTSCLVVVSLINYYIIGSKNYSAKIFWLFFSIGLQSLSLMFYFGLLSIRYIKPLLERNIFIRNVSTDRLNFIKDIEESMHLIEEPIDMARQHNYNKKESKRLIDEIEMTNVNLTG